jgi:uncharacterized protein (TIGR01777 family)
MTILVTGGTGLVGRAVIQTLLDQGAHVRVVTRRPHRALEYFDHRVTAFEWHPRTEPLPAPALDGVERIVHLMGEPLYGPLSRGRRSRIVASRQDATRALIEALGRSRVHLIAASSTAVYGRGEGPPLTETSAIKPPKNKLALALLACEEAADRLRENGSTVTVVRFGHVIAPDGAFTDALLSLHRRGMTWRDISPDSGIAAIDHEDAASLLAWLALSRPLPGPVHAVAPEPLRAADLKKMLAETSHRRPLAALPPLMLRPSLGYIADALGNRRQIVPRRALDAGFVFSRPDPLESVRAVLAQASAAQPVANKRPSLFGSVLQRT